MFLILNKKEKEFKNKKEQLIKLSFKVLDQDSSNSFLVFSRKKKQN